MNTPKDVIDFASRKAKIEERRKECVNPERKRFKREGGIVDIRNFKGLQGLDAMIQELSDYLFYSNRKYIADVYRERIASVMEHGCREIEGLQEYLGISNDEREAYATGRERVPRRIVVAYLDRLTSARELIISTLHR